MIKERKLFVESQTLASGGVEGAASCGGGVEGSGKGFEQLTTAYGHL